MAEDEIIIHPDSGIDIRCGKITWKAFDADEPLRRDDHRIRYSSPKKRAKFIDKWRRTHDEIAGVGANICVVEEFGLTEQAKRKIEVCALESAKYAGIPNVGYRIDDLSVNDKETGTGNWDKCGLEAPEQTPLSVKNMAEKHRKEMEHSMEIGDDFGRMLHFREMNRYLNLYKSMDKSVCYCAIAKFYTGSLFVDDWRSKYGG